VATYPLRGGPCNGRRSLNFTILPLEDFEVFCLGNTYAFSRADRAFNWVDTTGSPIGEAALGVRAPRGWRDLQISVGRRLPAALQKSARMRRAVKSKVARKRRAR
jgi:hypothetical protein